MQAGLIVLSAIALIEFFVILMQTIALKNKPSNHASAVETGDIHGSD